MPSGTMETFKVKNEGVDHTIFFNGKKCPRTAVKNVSPCILAEDYLNNPSASNSVKQEDGEEHHLSRDIETIFLPNVHEGVAVETPFFDYDYYQEVCRKRTERSEMPKLPVFDSDPSTDNVFKTTSEINNQCIYYIQQPQYPITIINMEQQTEHNDSPGNNTHINFNFFQQLPRESYVLENNNNPLYNSAEQITNVTSICNNKFITVKPDIALKEVNNKTKMYATCKTDSRQKGRLYQKRANRSSNNKSFLCKARKAPEKFIKSNIPFKEIVDVNENKTTVTHTSAYMSKSNIQSDPLYQQKVIISPENKKFLVKIAKKRTYKRIINEQPPDVPIKEVIELNKNKTHVQYKMGQDNILTGPVYQKKDGNSFFGIVQNFFGETRGETANRLNKHENKDMYIIENNDKEMPSVALNHENQVEISTNTTSSRGSTTSRNGNFENVPGHAEKRSKLVWHEENQLKQQKTEEKFKCPFCKRPREFLTLVAVNNHLKFNHISILPKARLEVEKK